MDELTGAERADLVAQLLDDLGQTPDAVAASLADQGITGRRGDACGCPIAALLTRQAPRPDGTPWVVGPAGALDGNGAPEVPLPAPVMEFVIQFDWGLYPGLVAS